MTNINLKSIRALMALSDVNCNVVMNLDEGNISNKYLMSRE